MVVIADVWWWWSWQSCGRSGCDGWWLGCNLNNNLNIASLHAQKRKISYNNKIKEIRVQGLGLYFMSCVFVFSQLSFPSPANKINSTRKSPFYSLLYKSSRVVVTSDQVNSNLWECIYAKMIYIYMCIQQHLHMQR